jgi:hypothetical protein
MGEGTMPIKSVLKIQGPDKQIFEMHEKGPDGNWFKHMQAVSTRG